MAIPNNFKQILCNKIDFISDLIKIERNDLISHLFLRLGQVYTTFLIFKFTSDSYHFIFIEINEWRTKHVYGIKLKLRSYTVFSFNSRSSCFYLNLPLMEIFWNKIITTVEIKYTQILKMEQNSKFWIEILKIYN